MGDVYTHGHHESVLRSHTWRTAENSAGYLLPHLRHGLDLLDVGCGPGTITLDLAALVAPGRVLGIDVAADVVAQASAAADGRAEFAVADTYDLDLPDASFDVVHAHQVLQHLTDPVAALRELRRVLRPGGLLAVRDSDYAGFFWSPPDPRLDRWLALYHQLTARNGAEADAGRRLPAWVRAAGFTDITVSGASWTFADDDSRAWWGGLWADRVEQSSFGAQAIESGLADATELADLARGWRTWAASPDAIFVVPHVEVLAREPDGRSHRSPVGAT
ncbi:MAG: methyltransferase domain-containing protein [Ilumatobacteraceae bacterium]